MEREREREREGVCVFGEGCEIERQGGRDGARYKYNQIGERGKKIFCTRFIDFNVDDDF